MQWEVQQVGLQWSNLSELAGTDSQLSFAAVALILCLDTLLYFLATWYIEQVAPGRYGVAKPLYFPFLPSYWLGQRGRDCAQTNSEQLDHGKICILSIVSYTPLHTSNSVGMLIILVRK